MVQNSILLLQGTLLLVSLAAISAESKGCTPLYDWAQDGSCEAQRMLCDVGEQCDDEKGPMCKQGLYCDSTSVCQVLISLGGKCQEDRECISGDCRALQGHAKQCQLRTTKQCGQETCGDSMYCSSVQSCEQRKEVGSGCSGTDVHECRGGLSCQPSPQGGAWTCQVQFSLEQGRTCDNSSTLGCEWGLVCGAESVCEPLGQGPCSTASHCGWPLSYCKCFNSEPGSCVPLRNPDCSSSVNQLVECMVNNNCDFDDGDALTSG